MDILRDKFGRTINYLRVSVTDRCNLRCVYCMPQEGVAHKDQTQILSFEEIYRIIRVAVALGIRKVRITGGEPLVRKDLPSLIAKLKTINGLNEIALTTNGIYLSDYARPLKIAGLDRVNISLDSLVPEKFHRITRGGGLEGALEGIESGLAAGFSPLKLNVVLLRGFNTDEIPSFVRLAEARPLHVRFIEYMNTGLGHFSEGEPYFSCVDAKNICAALWKLEPMDGLGSETARVFGIKGFRGTVGFVSPISEPFCFSCNKLRLTSNGRLRGCLHSSRAVDLKSAIDKGALDNDLVALIKEAAELKPESHNLSARPLVFEDVDNFSMCQIGG